tara:strand:+ start:210 stop:338 length:129 start_codon:yes stop_codon:yes gene_type:complete
MGTATPVRSSIRHHGNYSGDYTSGDYTSGDYTSANYTSGMDS